MGILKQEDSDSEEEQTELRHEGYLYKITQSRKLQKLWFKIIFKDLYYFKTKEDTIHKGMHNLSGVFLKEEDPINFDEKLLLCFSVIYPKKERKYYTDNQEEYKEWVKNVQKATGYSNLSDIYDVKVIYFLNTKTFLGKIRQWKIWPCKAWIS